MLTELLQQADADVSRGAEVGAVDGVHLSRGLRTWTRPLFQGCKLNGPIDII